MFIAAADSEIALYFQPDMSCLERCSGDDPPRVGIV